MENIIMTKVGEPQPKYHRYKVTNRNKSIYGSLMLFPHLHHSGDEIHFCGYNRIGNHMIEDYDASLSLRWDHFHS